MNELRKLITLIGAISIFIFFVSGCMFITPDYDSYTVSYIKVTPSSASMKVNTSKVFKVYAYDSENEVIPIDPSKVTWKWGGCSVCGLSAEINPKSGSTKTTFTPKKSGSYRIYATYKNKTDYSPITVY